MPYLKIKNVCVKYPESPGENALDKISFETEKSEFICIIGSVGSGKSTLLKTLVGLLRPHEGGIYFNDESYPKKGNRLRDLRRRIGMVFQFAETQVFEATVLDETLFGLRNFDFPENDILRLAEEGLKKVGLEPEIFRNKSPFELSGGERKRLALASILALEPEMLLLDEPASGLDSEGRKALLDILGNRKQSGCGLILVTHNLDFAAEICERVIVLHNGSKVYDGSRDIFYDFESLDNWNLDAPEITKIWHQMIVMGKAPDSKIYSIVEAEDIINNQKLSI